MSTEEKLLEAIEDEETEVHELESPDWREKQRRRLQKKNRPAIDQFLGKGRRTNTAGILPMYYGELLTWALHQHLERDGWKVLGVLGYRGPEPVYIKVDTGENIENLLADGQLLVERGDARYIVTVDINPRWRGSIQLEGPVTKKEETGKFVDAVLSIAEKENFYRGKKIEFSGRIRFLNIAGRSWESIVLDAETEEEIKANTVSFLKRGDHWSKYGIPLKRGILLAGEPGTGKTVICKALMAESDGITCITTSGYALDNDDYITELYELAGDLRPSIVFIEDIDLIGQDRTEFGYHRGPALLSLLAVLDGIEEKSEIVTVATTNCLETLDKALSQRPSRFDRVIKLTRPSLQQRRELVNRLCQKIPLEEVAQVYIAGKTENCTPAQLQEIVFSLVIKQSGDQPGFNFSGDEIDHTIARINDKNRHRLGFGGANHNDREPTRPTPQS